MNNAFPHVFLQSAGHTEGHLTEPALEGVVAHPAVSLHVPGELAALGTGVGAELTLVRFLSSVRPPVHRQVGAVLENLPAVLAGVLTTTSYEIFPGFWIKYGIQSSFLGEGPDGAGFHGRDGDTRGQGGKWDILD